MSQSTCELRIFPFRRALPIGRITELPVLIEIEPTRPEPSRPRPDLDLALVLDRSLSMEGAPLDHARRAACATIVSLRDSDRVALVAYGQEVKVLAALQPLKDKTPLLEGIGAIETEGGMTALRAGWEAGARELCGLEKRRLHAGASRWKNDRPGQRLRRILLLTDGRANLGLQHPRVLGERAADMAHKGIQTTTIGFGDEYQEGLLREMAAHGGGGHYYVERPTQMQDFFNLELARLEATVATSVRLKLVERAGGLRVDVLEDIALSEGGAWRLTDLAAGCTTRLMVNLVIPATANREKAAVARFALSWILPGTVLRETCEADLSLPLVSDDEWDAQPADERVHEHLCLSLAGEAQSEAARHLSFDDPSLASMALEAAFRQLDGLHSPESRAMRRDIEGQIDMVRWGFHSKASKRIVASRHGGHGMLGHIHSITRGKLRHLQGLVGQGSLATPLDEGQLDGWENAHIPRRRAGGMLMGTAAWDLASRATAQRAHPIDLPRPERHGPPCSFEPQEVAESLAGEPSLERMEGFRTRLGQGLPWSEAGAESEDDLALARVSGIVLPGAGTSACCRSTPHCMWPSPTETPRPSAPQWPSPGC